MEMDRPQRCMAGRMASQKQLTVDNKTEQNTQTQVAASGKQHDNMQHTLACANRAELSIIWTYTLKYTVMTADNMRVIEAFQNKVKPVKIEFSKMGFCT